MPSFRRKPESSFFEAGSRVIGHPRPARDNGILPLLDFDRGAGRLEVLLELRGVVLRHAFLEDGIYAEMIVDGLHIDPEMVKIAFKQKGADRIELITDAMRAKGMDDGISELGGQKVIVKEGQARLESGNLAGSVLEFQEAFKNIIAFTGCSILDAVKMSSVNQAREFDLVRKGGIAPGKDADMVLLSESFAVERAISYGQTAYKNNRK